MIRPMRNVFATLKRHRHLSLLSTVQHDRPVGTILRHSLPSQTETGIARRQETWHLSNLLQHYRFSTGFVSVHGESPSAEYAKLRKESLETEFGHIVGTHSSKSVSLVRFGPFLAVYRAAIISYHVLKLTIWQFFFRDIKKRAVKFRETLIRLGPFYIKLGQALSTRADILPPVYCQELAKLQDQIPPFPTRVAIKSIETELGIPVSEIFADISPEPIAAASLGQVRVFELNGCFIALSLAAHLHSGELVAVKVQRPGMSLMLTLDALLFHMIGGQLKRFAKARKDLLVAVNEMVRHMFDEIDYILEARNADRFASLYGDYPNGIKLTDEAGLKTASLNRRELIDQGVYCSLRQLLEVGFFHADPHPGNLVATSSGSLAYFDFGMMGDIPRHYRVGLIQVLVHFVNRDSLGLANDFLSLGFLPEGVDIQAVAGALQASFGDGTRQSQDFQSIMNQLYDVMYDFNFSLPPDYALVVRALGSLEGTAKALDPDFKVIESAYPFVIGRLLADPNPDMRKILRELLICNNGSIRWNRLERLVAAISEQASVSSEEHPNSEESGSHPFEWKSFDIRAVVAATEDLLLFILSEKGLMVRVFLLRDIIKAADVFLQDEGLGCSLDAKSNATKTSKSKDNNANITRIVNGFRSLNQAVKLAPEFTSFLKFIELLWRKSKSKFPMFPGNSQNGKFSYGYASSPGKRSSMEDFYETRIDGVDGEIVGLFGVFDGHGGARAAEYVKQNLFSNLISHPKFISDTKSAIADAYNHTDSEFLKSENNQNRDAGSTASTAILVGDRLLVANVGDSRAVICRGGNAIAVSRDHKPDQTDERQRIEDAGGFVMWAGTWRVGGVLAVSRAFGDRLLKQYVVADPEIQEEKVDSSLEFLILASDGLWDVVTNEEAVAMIKQIQDPEQAAKRLMQEAYQRGSADNITCVVVRFLANQGGSSHSVSA
ncbi:phosphatase 2C (PP2C)-like protein [Corchorus olitorius]|uniref:protein-serine/threonine phosphatase n=2 Tax=Corchorus TaxID=93758 RepID=A0A1R3J758_9ROSI|nr:phosphatase 2C (PP2C)-like protein [Corchorus olitorius]